MTHLGVIGLLPRRPERRSAKSGAGLLLQERGDVSKFIDFFDEVFVLDIDLGTLYQRLNQRPKGEWGLRPSERDLVVRLHQTNDEIPETGAVIDATRRLADVVDDIVHLDERAEATGGDA